jgi:chromosome segregation ATPase
MMEGDYGMRSLEKENECLKQTIYRLSLDLKSQQQSYEGEISYFKNLIDKHLKNLTEIEKTKHDLQSRIKYLNSQLTDSTEEIVRKNQEIDKLKGIIDKQKAYISHTESLVEEHKKIEKEKETESYEAQKIAQELKTSVANLESLTHQLKSRITDQDTRIEENLTVTNKIQQIVEVQLQQHLKRLCEDVPAKDSTKDKYDKLEEWKEQVDEDLSKLTTKVDRHTAEQLELKVNIRAIVDMQSAQSDEIRNIRNTQNDFLKIWLS